MIYCGIAWAERSHDVALVDDNGQLLAKRHITDDAAGYKIFLGLLVEYGDSEENPACRTASSENGRRCTCAQAGRSLRSPFRGGRQVRAAVLLAPRRRDGGRGSRWSRYGSPRRCRPRSRQRPQRLGGGPTGPRWNRIEAESLPVGRDRVPNLWRVEGLE